MSDIEKKLREKPYRLASETEDQAKIRRQEERIEGADRIAELESLIKDIHDKLYSGEIFGWDDGSDEWREMRVIARKSATEAPK